MTHRDFASTVTFVTGHEDPAKAESGIDWRQLAQLRGTKIFLMGVERLREIAQRLMAEGADPSTPIALVRWGTTGRQESLEGALSNVADLVEKHGFAAPAITIVGDVVRLRRELNWFEALPLFGRRVVVTRTRRQAGALTAKLARLGADVLEIPTIRIVPRPLDDSQRAKIANLSAHFDWLIFASPNAVELFFSEFFNIKADLRDLGPIKFASVGPATAQKLRELHLQVDLQPEVYTSENLANAFAQIDVRASRFCLPHGDLAAPFLADNLRKSGATLEEWIIYETVPETGDVTGARARYLREGAHWITFTSASTVENWHALQLQPDGGTPTSQSRQHRAGDHRGTETAELSRSRRGTHGNARFISRDYSSFSYRLIPCRPQRN